MKPPEGPRLPAAKPWAYFLTFSCYGKRLHGHPRGSVDPHHNEWSAPFVPANQDRLRSAQSRLQSQPATLTPPERNVVLTSISAVADHENWTLHAAHIRPDHAHIVVAADGPPEPVLAKLKTYASRALNQEFGKRNRRWSRHGSTRWLWTTQEVDAAVHYVLHEQGEPAATYLNPTRWEDHIRKTPGRSGEPSLR